MNQLLRNTIITVTCSSLPTKLSDHTLCFTVIDSFLLQESQLEQSRLQLQDVQQEKDKLLQQVRALLLSVVVSSSLYTSLRKVQN